MAKRSMTLSEWWDDNGIYCIIIGSVIGIILFYLFCRNRESSIHPDVQLYFSSDKDYTKRKRRAPVESKGEMICKDVAVRLFNKPFQKIRPDFLKNEKTGNNLEIDIYNDELKLGIEYSGKQHYEYTPYLHKNYQAFLEQVERDKIKEQKCKENGINLIVVPYTIKHDNIESYLHKKIRDFGYGV